MKDHIKHAINNDETRIIIPATDVPTVLLNTFSKGTNKSNNSTKSTTEKENAFLKNPLIDDNIIKEAVTKFITYQLKNAARNKYPRKIALVAANKTNNSKQIKNTIILYCFSMLFSECFTDHLCTFVDKRKKMLNMQYMLFVIYFSFLP
ncbi:hypothetical protein DRA42_08670 [Ethanoligenens harbinense]|nr:hypothetical protein CXQ68_08640 [Ethanoligenens harbinense YUAN-3]AYF38944.1 hypothetical protein CXP51_08510 [Ethanoligenens harbinense]AYF41696.1 hypothetical protein CN246_08660 [Ethanoligenens harbinense]QCN92526.1 hypothetical protein DRA42_08670 [Ethanoligenens harbinense]